MVKSRTTLMVYCFAIHTIFQAAGFPSKIPSIDLPFSVVEIKNILSKYEHLIPNTIRDSCWNIENGLLKEEFKNWGQTYLVSFDIVVKKLPTSLWLNVFHFTATNEDVGTNGDRIPGLWINKDGYFHICTSLNGNANACKNIGFILENDYHVIIKQVKDGRKYFYEIIVNGISQFKEENKKPLKFSTVSLYGSDPWYDSFTSEFGRLCNVVINQEVGANSLSPLAIPIEDIKGANSGCPNSLAPLATIEDIEAINEIEDEAERINCLQQIGVEQATNLLLYANKTVEEVDELVRQSQIAIAQLKAQSKDLNLEKLKLTNNFITKFNDAKANLLEARRELVTLASETVLLCDNIEILIADWKDKHAMILLNAQFDNLRRLIEKTKTRLSFAKEKYAALIDTFLTMNEDIDLFKIKLQNAVDENSAEFKKWSSGIRAAYISSATATTVAMIIADIFGCVGICSATVTTTTWGTLAPTAEIAINNYKGEITALKDQVNNAIKYMKKLDQSTEGAVELITHEMNLVIRWQAAADNVENTINDFTPEELQDIRAFQSIFANSIRKLKNAAQGFYDFASSEKPVLEG